MKKTNNNYFCLNNISKFRIEMFGISTLLIIFYHLGNRGIPGASFLVDPISDFLFFLTSKANIGVDVFVFLSAIGLFYSMSRNSIKTFYRNRFSRVLITWFIMMGPTFVKYDIIHSGEGVAKRILDFFLDISTLRYWVDYDNSNTPWFVPFIIVLYILFPLLYRLDNCTKHIVTITLIIISIIICFAGYSNEIIIKYGNCFSRLPIFFIGILMANGVKTKKAIEKIYPIIILCVFVILYILWFFLKLPFVIDMLFGSIVAFLLIMVYSFLREMVNIKHLSKMFISFGSVSLEVFLIHRAILGMFDRYNVPHLLFASFYIILPILSLFLAKLYSSVLEKIKKQ